MKRRSLKTILRKHPGAIAFFRPSESNKLLRRRSREDANESIARSFIHYFDHRTLRTEDIQKALEGAKQRGIINREQMEILARAARNYVGKPIALLIASVEHFASSYTEHLRWTHRTHREPVSERDYNRTQRFIAPFAAFLYQRTLLHDFFEQRGIPVSDAHLNRLAQPKIVEPGELWEKPVEREVILESKRGRIERGYSIMLRRETMQRIKGMLDNDFFLSPAEKKKLFHAATTKTAIPVPLEQVFSDAQRTALRLHNAKLKELLVQQGLGNLKVPSRISALRIPEPKKSDLQYQLVSLLSQGPVSVEKVEQLIRTVEQPVSPQSAKKEQVVRRPKAIARSAGSVFFESLQRRGLLNGPQLRQLRALLSQRVGPIRSLDTGFFQALEQKIAKNPAVVQGKPAKIVELAIPNNSSAPTEKRRANRLLPATPKTLQELVTETLNAFVPPATIIALRQQLAHLTKSDLKDAKSARTVRRGIREVVLADLASRGFKGRINPQVLRFFTVKSPSLAPIFGEVLRELINDGTVLEHRRGYLTVSLDPSQTIVLQKYQSRRNLHE